MTIYVLTQSENARKAPVGATTSMKKANEWASKARSNDWYQFELDMLEHLGLENGPTVSEMPNVSAIVFPNPPEIDEDGDPKEAMESMCAYLLALSGSMEEIQRRYVR